MHQRSYLQNVDLKTAVYSIVQTIHEYRQLDITCGTPIAIVTTPDKNSVPTMALIAYRGFRSVSSIIQDMFLSVVADIWLHLRCTYVASKQMMISRAIRATLFAKVDYHAVPVTYQTQY